MSLMPFPGLRSTEMADIPFGLETEIGTGLGNALVLVIVGGASAGVHLKMLNQRTPGN